MGISNETSHIGSDEMGKAQATRLETDFIAVVGGARYRRGYQISIEKGDAAGV
jgi:hypothetical protein